MRRVHVIALALSFGGGPAGCREAETQAPEPSAAANPAKAQAREPFLARRAAHETILSERAPSPGEYTEYSPPRGVSRVTYASGELDLEAWYAVPLGASRGSRSAPALVYFHGDFAFGPDDFEVVRPFLDAGYVVMTPMLRGENGNPGEFELLFGEVDDARAAIHWVASQPQVDLDRIYAFGHSIGGGITALLSLYPELPLRASASCGGIYVPETFGRWAQSELNRELVRFDPEDRDETELRVLGPNLEWMAHRHIAYVGEDDEWFVRNAGQLAARAWTLGKPFERVVVPGDHMGSLKPALDSFLRLTQGTAAG